MPRMGQRLMIVDQHLVSRSDDQSSCMCHSLVTSPKAAMLTSPPTQPAQLYTDVLCPALLLQGCLRVHRHNAQESATHVPFRHHPERVSTQRTQEAAGAQADDEAPGCQRVHVAFFILPCHCISSSSGVEKRPARVLGIWCCAAQTNASSSLDKQGLPSGPERTRGVVENSELQSKCGNPNARRQLGGLKEAAP